jgi:mRNA interferase RelE/StbE
LPDYMVIFTSAAQKELKRLSFSMEHRILMKIMELKEDPRPRGCIKLRGDEAIWRIRVGDYRVLYEIDDLERVVDIVYVRHRKNAYE